MKRAREKFENIPCVDVFFTDSLGEYNSTPLVVSKLRNNAVYDGWGGLVEWCTRCWRRRLYMAGARLPPPLGWRWIAIFSPKRNNRGTDCKPREGEEEEVVAESERSLSSHSSVCHSHNITHSPHRTVWHQLFNLLSVATAALDYAKKVAARSWSRRRQIDDHEILILTQSRDCVSFISSIGNLWIKMITPYNREHVLNEVPKSNRKYRVFNLKWLFPILFWIQLYILLSTSVTFSKLFTSSFRSKEQNQSHGGRWGHEGGWETTII